MLCIMFTQNIKMHNSMSDRPDNRLLFKLLPAGLLGENIECFWPLSLLSAQEELCDAGGTVPLAALPCQLQSCVLHSYKTAEFPWRMKPAANEKQTPLCSRCSMRNGLWERKREGHSERERDDWDKGRGIKGEQTEIESLICWLMPLKSSSLEIQLVHLSFSC